MLDPPTASSGRTSIRRSVRIIFRCCPAAMSNPKNECDNISIFATMSPRSWCSKFLRLVNQGAICEQRVPITLDKATVDKLQANKKWLGDRIAAPPHPRGLRWRW
jgi:hypothetical protein